MSNEIMVQGSNAVATKQQMSVPELVEQVQVIQQVLKSVMKKGVHYDEIPGTGKWEKINGKWDYVPGKPVLLKAGVDAPASINTMPNAMIGAHLSRTTCTMQRVRPARSFS